MEILGLLDTLESMILEGFKIPMSKKTVIDEDKILQVIDKIRLVSQGGGDLVKRALDKRPSQVKQELMDFSESKRDIVKMNEAMPQVGGGEEKATEVIENAYKIAKEVRMGADKYADEVLTNLEATTSRILRAVKAGRTKLGRVNNGGINDEKA
jgi:predicted nucleotide-binding protein (sugar kinase/HSP70/actin superfamily)